MGIVFKNGSTLNIVKDDQEKLRGFNTNNIIMPNIENEDSNKILLFALLEGIENAIEIGDWKVDGRCDPTHIIELLKEKFGKEYDEFKKEELAEWA